MKNLWLIIGLLCGWSAATVANTSPVLVLTIDGTIQPAAANYLKSGLKHAEYQQHSAVILKLNTPGGLDSSMREMVQAIVSSAIPVIVYVSPSGGRAASAGTYLLYASHVAAMADGTNVGAATPVKLLGEDDETTLQQKIRHDSAAYLRSLAELRQRNVDWAVQAVRDADSITAQTALQKQVIDIIANDLPDLLKQLHGRQIKFPHKIITLDTNHAAIETYEQDWRNRLLSIITDPNIAYLLMLLGIYGLFFEFYHPGTGIPGVVGTIAILLALFAFQVLPVNFVGLTLILFGIFFMIAEALTPSFGILGFGGIVAFVIGSIMLFDSNSPDFEIAYSLIATFSVTNAILFLWVGKKLSDLRNQKPLTGYEQMLGEIGECISVENKQLRVSIHGEIWQARSSQSLTVGQMVKIKNVDGLTLDVEPLN
ncbi:MAG: hypothetical protein RIT27_170 [Pseudomonadota bacterium]|jgi:membrane-bound serine protease (ClpP class)